MPILQVRLEEEDYVNALRAAARPGVRTMTLLAAASALVVVGAFVGWRAGYMKEVFVAGFVWFGALVGAGIGHMLSIGPKAKRVFRQQQALQRPYEVSWSDVGVTITGEGHTSTTPWADFHKSLEIGDQFILFLSDAIFFMVPKRAFADSSLMREFRESVTTRIQRR